MVPQFEINLFEILIALVVFIVWLARLEFIAAQNKKDIALLWEKHDDLSEKLADELKTVGTQLNAVTSSLARIEGFLSGKKEL